MKKIFALPLSLMALGVILGAFGAHFLNNRLSEHYLQVYKTANFYHFIHALGWMLILIIGQLNNWKTLRWVNGLFILGFIFFSGSLYILSLNEWLNMYWLKKLGAVAPLGALAWIIAWFWSVRNVFANAKKIIRSD